MFLAHAMGHQGPSAHFPCTFCMVKNADLKKKSIDKEILEDHPERSFELNSNKSQTDTPLFPVSLANICPPVLHIPLGLVSDIFKKIHF